MRRWQALYGVGVLALIVTGCTLTQTQPPPTPTLLPSPAATLPPRPTPVAIFIPSDTPRPTLVPTATVPTATPSPMPSPTPAPFALRAEVAAYGDGLRLRAQPGLSAEVLANLPAGTVLTVVGRTADAGWFQVQMPQDGLSGWVWGNYLLGLDDEKQAQLAVTGQTLLPPTVPALSGASVITNVGATARQIYARGQQMGNRPDVFSKVGDSLTVATFVLYPFGWGTYDLGPYQHLQPVLNYFTTTNAREGNSFANVSLAADNGWTTRDLLDPAKARSGICQAGETPLACEYRVVKPALALILIGTNDLASVPLDEYRANLQRITQISIDQGVIPVLSTLPNRVGFDVTPFNQAILATAQAQGVPLWDYWSAMQPLSSSGLSADGVHPSYPAENDFAAAADFSGSLDYGYVIRNLTALEVLDALWRSILSY